MTFFGLRVKGEKFPLGCIAGGDDGGMTIHDLVKNSLSIHTPWMVSRREIAEKAAVTNSDWMNADYETPTNGYVNEEIEVIEFTLTY